MRGKSPILAEMTSSAQSEGKAVVGGIPSGTSRISSTVPTVRLCKKNPANLISSYEYYRFFNWPNQDSIEKYV